MHKIEDIKSGDIIYVPNLEWLLFVTHGKRLVWLSTETITGIPCALNSFTRDIDSNRRAIVHLSDAGEFIILGNIKRLIKLGDEELDRD